APGAMGGRTMQDMPMGWLTQEGAPLRSTWQPLGVKRERTPCRDQAAHVHAPVRSEMIDHPVIALHVRELCDHVDQMCRTIHPGTRGAEIPHHLPRRDDKRGQQRSRAMPNVFLLA